MGEQRDRLRKLQSLTGRETEVLKLRCEGKSYLEISEDLVITIPTVKSHFQHIYQKLGLDELAHARRNMELFQYCSVLQQTGLEQATTQ